VDILPIWELPIFARIVLLETVVAISLLLARLAFICRKNCPPLPPEPPALAAAPCTKVRSIPNPRDELREQMRNESTMDEWDAAVDSTRMDHFMTGMQESLSMADRRIELLEALEWSFPLEDVQISRGPVTIKWNTHLDDFWADNVDPRRILDSSVKQGRFEDDVPPAVYQAAQIQFEQTQQIIESLQWQKLPVRAWEFVTSKWQKERSAARFIAGMLETL
jgi:hypothetical protein